MISEDPLAARENVEIAAPTSFDLSFATFCRENRRATLGAWLPLNYIAQDWDRMLQEFV